MTDSELIDKLGGNAIVAKLCGNLAAVVSGWRKRGIPEGWRKYLKAKCPQVFKDAGL